MRCCVFNYVRRYSKYNFGVCTVHFSRMLCLFYFYSGAWRRIRKRTKSCWSHLETCIYINSFESMFLESVFRIFPVFLFEHNNYFVNCHSGFHCIAIPWHAWFLNMLFGKQSLELNPDMWNYQNSSNHVLLSTKMSTCYATYIRWGVGLTKKIINLGVHHSSHSLRT